jgi:hypothetical protein
MSQRLRELIAQFEDLSQEGLSTQILVQEKLQTFEVASGFLLPPDYKEFCQIIGTATLSNFVDIYIPDMERSKRIIKLLKQNLQTQIEYGEAEDLDIEFVSELIDFAFVFAHTPNAEDIIWDLRTYRKSDQSYDIYLVPAYEIEAVYLIGRDFCDFLREFCFGELAFDLLPSFRHPLAMYPGYHRGSMS